MSLEREIVWLHQNRGPYREATMAKPKILRFKELRDYGVPYSRSYIDVLEKEGLFPKRIAISTYRVGWLESEIIAWVEKLLAGRSQEKGKLGSTGKLKKLGFAARDPSNPSKHPQMRRDKD